MRFFNLRRIPPLRLFLIGLAACLVLNWGGAGGWRAVLPVSAAPPPRQGLTERASSYYWQGEYREAILLWEEQLASASAAEAANLHRYLGVAYRQLGQLGTALRHFRQARPFYERRDELAARHYLAEVLVEQARIHNELGQGSRALPLLEQGLDLIERGGWLPLEAAAYRELGSAYLLARDFDRALAAYERSRDLAAIGKQDEALAAAFNNLTNARLKRQAHYQQESKAAAAEGNASEASRLSFLAEQDGKAALTAASGAVESSRGKASFSAVKARLNWAQLANRPDYRLEAKKMLEELPPSREKANLLMNLAEGESGESKNALLEEAARLAAAAGDFRTQSFALGQLGQSSEQAGHYDLARQQTQKAQWSAQQVSADDSLYRWQWQAGRIYRATGQVETAEAAYQGALATLQKLRGEIASASPALQVDVREEVEPIYRELLSLLLAEQPGQPERLQKALAVKKQLQLTELQSFFGDACLELKQALREESLSLPEKTARVQTVILDEATYTIWELPDGKLHAYRVEVRASQLQQKLEQWRQQLESRRIPLGYRDLSERLYDQLVRPAEALLAEAGVETLLFVNDGRLRNVPMAALHDGQQFLIEKFAVANSLGLDLTSPAGTAAGYRATIFGLTAPTGGFPPLPQVADETSQVIQLLGGERFLDREFTLANLQAQVKKNYPVVHLATHGEFGGTAGTAFLQTFDAPLFLADLERILSQRRDPIELLALSACDTAAGNDRAFLGLAGVALRSGTKNVLASLWSVRDPDASSLVTSFYSYWKQGISPAQALRQAQRKLIAAPNSHPKNWAAFVEIVS